MQDHFKVASQVFDIPSSGKQKKAAIIVAVIITSISTIVLPHGMRLLPEIEPFLSASIAWLIFGDLLTAYIVYSQYRASGFPSLLVLSCTYLYTGLMTTMHIATFPGLLKNMLQFGPESQTAGWLWVFWHGGFAIGILLYIFTKMRWSKPLETVEQIFNLGTAGIVITLLTVFGMLELAMASGDLLPDIIHHGDYRKLNTSGIGPIIWILNLTALLAVGYRTKGQTVLNLWLTVAVLALLMDITLTLFAGTRFTLGWYLAKMNSAFAATVVIISALSEVNRLFIRLSEQHRQLVESGKQLEQVNEKLTQLTNLDGLTEIPNRRRFDEILAWEMVCPEERLTSLSLLIIDVDCFKAYNDHYGHQGGDQVLKWIAQTIYNGVKGIHGFAARYGGEEFVVVLSDCDAEETRQVAEMIRKAVADLAIKHEVSMAGSHVTISIGGYCLAPKDPLDQQDLIRRADHCLYKAKDAGRNQSFVQGWSRNTAANYRES